MAYTHKTASKPSSLAPCKTLVFEGVDGHFYASIDGAFFNDVTLSVDQLGEALRILQALKEEIESRGRP